MNFRTLPIRVDGNSKIGYGHFYRTLSLATMLSSEFKIVFFCRNTESILIQNAVSSGFQVINISPETGDHDEAEFIISACPDTQRFIIIDGYSFTDEYQLSLKKSGFRILNIADEESSITYSDFIISQCLPSFMITGAKVYSGFEYALLRSNFYNETLLPRSITKADTAFIIFGSAMIKGLAYKVLEAFTRKPGIKRIHLVKPSHNYYSEEIKQFTESSFCNISLYNDVKPDQMAELMRISDFAFTPSSISSLEACTVGIGLFSGYTAKNQICTYETHKSLQTIFPLGDLHDDFGEKIIEILKSEYLIDLINLQVLNQKNAIKNDPETFLKIVREALP